MAMLSISLDLVDSTAKKNGIERTCKTLEHAHKQFETLARLFYRIETSLYATLISQGIQPSSIFHMKSIGDEVWVVIELLDPGPSSRFNSDVATVVQACVAAACQAVEFDYTRRAFTQAEETADPPTLKLRPVHLRIPVKIYVDLVDEAVETSQIRLDVFQKDLASLMLSAPKGGKTPAPPGASALALLERLGGFSLTPQTPPKVKYRTDYIGPQVDLFFRCTKAAVPGRVVIGERLVSRLTRPSGRAVAPSAGRRLAIGNELERFGVVRRIHLTRKQLKGCPKPYDAYLLRDRETEKLMALAGWATKTRRPGGRRSPKRRPNSGLPRPSR